jgi:hypothetical protein
MFKIYDKTEFLLMVGLLLLTQRGEMKRHISLCHIKHKRKSSKNIDNIKKLKNIPNIFIQKQEDKNENS